MMAILQGKFGRTFIIVESVVSDIEKVKPIAGEKADKLFVYFVEPWRRSNEISKVQIFSAKYPTQLLL